MNKIYIDTSNYDLVIDKNTTYYLVNTSSNLKLKIKILKDVKAIIYLETIEKNVDVQVQIQDNGSLLVNSLGINASISSYTTLGEKSSLRFVSSIIANTETLNNIQINHLGKESKSTYLANGVNLGNNKFYFAIDGIITKESRGSSLDEKSSIINIVNGDSKIIPNMLIDNEDVIANHSAYIGKLNNDDIYYLEARGLSLKEIEKILLKANLLKGMEDEIRKTFTSIINDKINL